MATLSLSVQLRDGTKREFSHGVGSEIAPCDLKQLQKAIKTVKEEVNGALTDVVNQERADNANTGTGTGGNATAGTGTESDDDDDDDGEEDDDNDENGENDIDRCSEPAQKKAKT